MHSILCTALYHHGMSLTSLDASNFTFFAIPPAGGCSTNFTEAISELIKFTQIYESKWNKKNIQREKCFFTYFYKRLFLLWRREKDFNAEKLGFSFHFCARKLITKVRERLINFPSACWLRLLRLFIFAQNSLLVPRARTASLGRRTYSGGPRKMWTKYE